ncbi:hypothetical protein LAJPDJIK_02935 [Aeromonas salmonicida]
MFEQIHPEAALEAQIRVVQRHILTIEHPALRDLPPVEPCREAVHRDRLLEVAGRIHLVIGKGQSGTAPRRGQPEFAIEILHAGHILPGADLDVG